MSKEVPPEVIKKTQKSLGKYIKKPLLTEKLLMKPPFRFLHDVVKSVIKETGFLKGLFSEAELETQNVSNKDDKIAFLNKLIDAIKTLTKLELSIKASKIVAGLEPTNTNILLQYIGKAIESKVDSSLYIAKLKSSNENHKKILKTTDDKIKSKSKTNGSRNREKNKTKEDDTPKLNRDRTPRDKINTPKEIHGNENVNEKTGEKNKRKKNTQSESNNIIDTKTHKDRLQTKNEVRTEENNLDIVQNIPISENETKEINNNPTIPSNQNNDTGLVNLDKSYANEDTNTIKEKVRRSATLLRPKSARPKSSDVNVLSNNAVPNQNNVEIMEVSATTKSGQLLRPPSARPPSARPAAPRLQRPDSALELSLGEATLLGAGVSVIVEGADNDDEGTIVVIEEADGETDNRPSPIDSVQLPSDNQGHLVEQILEQINDKEFADDAKEVDVVRNLDGYGKISAAKDIDQLRVLIQNVTKTVSPLGKLLSCLHEDIDAMYSEMQTWTNTRKQIYSEIKKQKRINEESTKPLLDYLNQLQDEIKKEQQEITDVQNTIFRNDLRIKELLLFK